MRRPRGDGLRPRHGRTPPPPPLRDSRPDALQGDARLGGRGEVLVPPRTRRGGRIPPAHPGRRAPSPLVPAPQRGHGSEGVPPTAAPMTYVLYMRNGHTLADRDDRWRFEWTTRTRFSERNTRRLSSC